MRARTGASATRNSGCCGRRGQCGLEKGLRPGAVDRWCTIQGKSQEMQILVPILVCGRILVRQPLWARFPCLLNQGFTSVTFKIPD